MTHWSEPVCNTATLPLRRSGIAADINPVIKRDTTDAPSSFFESFECVIANTSEELASCFMARHKVYCEELGFETIQPSRLENDEFDGHSVHCLIRHRFTLEVAGTVRLVVPTKQAHKLPLERLFSSLAVHGEDPPCEVSRLAIPKSFRRGTQEPFSKEKLLYGNISIALYLMAAHIFDTLSRRNIYIVTEPRLARSLRLVGFNLEQLGEPVDHRGLRAPYKMCVAQILRDLSPRLKQFYEIIASQLTACPSVPLPKLG